MKKQHSKVSKIVTSSGEEVTIRPISVKLLEMFDASHNAPEPPMMEAQSLGGPEQVPDNDNPEYQAALAAYNKRSSDEFITMILDLGVDLEMPEDGAWKRQLKRMGVALPDDPDEQRLIYIQTFLMPAFTDDLRDITAAVLRLSGVSEEAIASWTALFRSQVDG